VIPTILCSAGIAAVALLASIEFYNWHRKISNPTRRQKTYRVISAVLLEVLLLMMLFFRQFANVTRPVIALAYMGAGCGLFFLLFLVVLLDLREIRKVYGSHRAEILRDILEEEMRNK
jgi:protein-S-isoprenylcysteine O-methyltransferase Ste14